MRERGLGIGGCTCLFNCNCGIFNAIAVCLTGLTPRLQASQHWQQLLGQPVGAGRLTAQHAQRILLRLAAEGAPKVAPWALLAAQAVERVEASATEAAGNLAGGLLCLAGSTQRGADGRAVLGPRTALKAVRAAGAPNASLTGVQWAAARLERSRQELGLPDPPPGACAAEARRLRQQWLEALLQQLAAIGELPQGHEDVQLLMRLEASLPPVQWPVGTLAIALLCVLGRARGGAASSAAAAAAVARAGGEGSASVAFHMKLLQQHWQVRGGGVIVWKPGWGSCTELERITQSSAGCAQASALSLPACRPPYVLLLRQRVWVAPLLQTNAEWQSLLGPVRDGEDLARQRLASLLDALGERDGGDGCTAARALLERELRIVQKLAADFMSGPSPPKRHQVGAVVAALLVLFGSARGQRMGKRRAVAEVQAAGGRASEKGLLTQLSHLREHWKVSATLCTLWGAARCGVALPPAPYVQLPCLGRAIFSAPALVACSSPICC